MANPAPGYKKYPDHRLAVRRAKGRVQVTYKGDLIADTRRAVCMQETHEGSVLAPEVYYVPREDVKMDRLARTAHHSYCPFKGEASYFSLRDGPDNAAWSYEQPYDEMLAIKDLLAFYPDKVDIIVAA